MNISASSSKLPPLYRLLTVCVALACMTGTSQAQSLRTTKQFHESTQLHSWTEDGQLLFKDSQNQSISVPLDSVIRYGIGVHSRTGQGVLLIDGSLLIGRITKITAESCDFTGQYFRTTIPRPLIRSVLFNAPGLNGIQQEWLAFAKAASGSDDKIQTVNGDVVSGTIEQNYEGIVYDAGSLDRLHITNENFARKIPWQQIRGAIFSPLLSPLISPPSDSVTIGLKNGTRLISTNVIGPAAGVWKFQLACGMEILTSGKQFPVDQICYISPAKLAPDSTSGLITLANSVLRVRQTPMFGAPANIDLQKIGAGQGTIEVRDGWIDHAIRIKPGTQAVFRLPSNAKKLTTELLADFESPSTEKPTATSIIPVRCSISIVRSGGKVEEVWTIDELNLQTLLQPIEVNLQQTEAVAVIMSVEPATTLQPVVDSVWISPLIHTD